MKPWARPLALCSVLLACSGESGSRALRARDSLLSRVNSAPSYASPARFRYHPTRQAAMHAERRLSDGRRLLVGGRGERWILDPRTQGLISGANLAPEDLIAVLAADAGYWFIGQSGTNYEARDPLGEFVRSSAPLEPLVRVSAARQSIIGISRDHALTRSVDGAASFTRVGPKKASFVDVALADDGTGLALAVPEALWLTRDEGATWSELPGKTRGAFALARDRLGQLRIDGLFGPYHFADQPARLEVGAPPDASEALVRSSPPRGPDAAALADGRAVVLGTRYLEVVALPGHPSDYQLLSGPLDGTLLASPLPELKSCPSARLTGFDQYLELACFHGASDAGSVLVSFFRSDTFGRHFEREPFASFGTPLSFRFAVGARGALIATGLCSAPGPGCSTGGLFVRREVPPEEALARRAASEPKEALAQRAASEPKAAAKRFELFAAAAPTLAESALGLTFSLDGHTGYAIGRRSKTGALAMFVSRDGGTSFDVHDLDLVRADSDDEEQYWEHSQASQRVESFAAAEDGALSVVLADRRGRTLIVSDERGRLLSGSKPPDDGALVAAVGMRAFALAPRTRQTWESLDGGVTWQALSRFPVALCAAQGECEVQLRCAPPGCVIGNEVSRIGWVGQQDDNADSVPPPAAEPSPLVERKLRTSIACTLGDSVWQTLAGVHDVPNSHDAAFGKVSFVAVATDAAHASAWTLHGFGDPKPHIETVSLLGPVNRPREYALELLDQVEGAAALRYRLPDDPAKDSHLRNVEVAWDNVLSGQIARARLPDGGPVAPADYALGDPVQHADPDLLSIGEGGLYLRLHHSAADAQDTWFFDGHTTTRIPKVNWPIAGGLRGRSEMTHTEHAHVPLMFFGRGSAVARARLVGSEWEFDAETTGLPDANAFGQTLTSNVSYLGSNSGWCLQTQSSAGLAASSEFYAFRASGSVLGPAIAVPTQADLGDRPGRCSPSDLATTPRTDANFLPGTRHAVLVTDSSDPPRLFLSSAAVLYGTPENACASAFDADELVLDGGQLRREHALVVLDDLEHAWLFRSAEETGSHPSLVQYRTMNCHFDANLEVPSEVYRAPGTLVPRGG